MSAASIYSSRECDNELLAAVAVGNRGALEELYVAYRRRLACFLMRFTQCPENIEEIINDTFMVVWRNANDFRWASQVSSWIFGIAHRTALKSARRQKRYSGARDLHEYEEPSVDPMRDTEIQDWLMHGLDRLPDEQRLSLELACRLGHSLAEIAEITGAPIGTVKARIFHARRNLRRHLPTLSGAA